MQPVNSKRPSQHRYSHISSTSFKHPNFGFHHWIM